MMTVFVASLVIGLGALAVQLLGGHDVGHDVSPGLGDAGHDVDAHDTPFLFLASVRFWAFTLLVFGLVGTLLRIFGFAGVLESSLIAGVAGLFAGYVATSIMRRLQTQATSSMGTSGEVVGRVGRVIVAPSSDARGKVRVSIRGSFVDYVASSADPLEADDSVVVEEYEGGEVRVSRAPKELAEPRS